MKKVILGCLVASAASVFAVTLNSGLGVGEMVTPFHPTHLSGPDKGTDTCPPCKYGARPAVQVWVNGDAPANVMAIAKTLSAEVTDSSKELKGFVINLSNDSSSAAALAAKAPQNIAVAVLKPTDAAVKNYKVNTAAEVKNTVFVYRNKKVTAKFVNFVANEKNLSELRTAINAAEAL